LSGYGKYTRPAIPVYLRGCEGPTRIDSQSLQSNAKVSPITPYFWIRDSSHSYCFSFRMAAMSAVQMESLVSSANSSYIAFKSARKLGVQCIDTFGGFESSSVVMRSVNSMLFWNGINPDSPNATLAVALPNQLHRQVFDSVRERFLLPLPHHTRQLAPNPPPRSHASRFCGFADRPHEVLCLFRSQHEPPVVGANCGRRNRAHCDSDTLFRKGQVFRCFLKHLVPKSRTAWIPQV